MIPVLAEQCCHKFFSLLDPFCRLGVLSATHREKSIVKQKDLEQWRKEGLVESTVSTTVRKVTSEPEWNEEFEL